MAEPVERPWGGRSTYVADPEGNRWEIAWASAARFDGRGALTGFGG
ncbi:VOC family protein [Nocardiopsis synnemataformans]